MTFNKAKTIISKPKFTTGFTLVEMMVAIAVFSIVMVAAMSALLNVIDANNKARAIKTAINNVSFALEGITKDMRVGTNYLCGNDLDTVRNAMGLNGLDCSDQGGSVIGYRSTRTGEKVAGKYNYVFYRFNASSIDECMEKNGIICSDSSKFNKITSSEVEIATNSRFYVIGANTAGKQPRMIMTLSGTAGAKAKIQTTFDLQTSVSQRTRTKI